MPDATAFAAGRERRDVRVLARTITLAENEPREAYGVLSESGIPPGSSHVIGITGPPGVGKSSLVNAMVAEFRTQGETVAVLAIDPSSPFRGGALLGDRIRMNAHAGDPGVYIRSMATRGVLGGLSRAAWLGARVLETWGFNWIVIETAGVGQSEIDVVDLADTTVLVLSPGLGDDVQVMKAGIMEVADIFVINKSDLIGSERVRNSLVSVLADAGGEPTVFSTIANAARNSSGVRQFTDGLIARVNSLVGSERLAEFRAKRTRVEIRRAALSLFGEMVDRALDDDVTTTAAPIDPLAEGERIVAQLISPNQGQPTGEEHWC